MSWTSMPVQNQQLVFAIARNITDKKKLEEFSRTSAIFNNTIEGKTALAQNNGVLKGTSPAGLPDSDSLKPISELSIADKLWLYKLEMLVRKYIGKVDLSIVSLSSEMGLSERQLHRRIKSITGMTPNNYIRRIRLHMSMEAINSGKYRTVGEISYVAGFETPAYFSKLFKEFYGRDVFELLQ